MVETVNVLANSLGGDEASAIQTHVDSVIKTITD
jgi:hypothetical protein